MQHPGGSSGLRLLVRKVGITYGSLLACFLNDFALQITGTYTYVRVLLSAIMKTPCGIKF